MKQLWQKVGFEPHTFEMEEDAQVNDEAHQAEQDTQLQDIRSFPSQQKIQPPSESDISKFDGITVKNRSW